MPTIVEVPSCTAGVSAGNNGVPGVGSSLSHGSIPLLHGFNHVMHHCICVPTLVLSQMNERDRIAVMFCGTHKTLAFGIPLIKVRTAPGWGSPIYNKACWYWCATNAFNPHPYNMLGVFLSFPGHDKVCHGPKQPTYILAQPSSKNKSD